MTAARYKDIGVRLDAFQKIFPELIKQAGWHLVSVNTEQNAVIFDLKLGLVNRALVKVQGSPQDFQAEMIGSGKVMDVIEKAVISSCDNPSGIVGWRNQKIQKAQEVTTSSQPQPQPVPPPSTASIATPKPAAVPKLEACLYCNAPITHNPEEFLVICNYCGYINNPTGDQPPRYSMLPVLIGGTQAIEIAKTHVAKGILVTREMANRAEWGAIFLRYVPNWAVTMQLKGEVQGEKALYKTKDTKGQIAQEVAMHALGGVIGGIFGRGAGKAIADRTEKDPVSEAVDVFVVARRAAEYQPDVGALKIPLDKKEPFKKTGEETLNVEVNPTEAAEKAKGLAIQDVRSRYSTVSQFNLTATPIGDAELIYSPWWFIEYRMGRTSYSLIVDACHGGVIAGRRPWLPKGTTKPR